MKCPNCQSEKLNRKVTNIYDTPIGITLTLTNQCLGCRKAFQTIAEYSLKREFINVVDGEIVEDNAGIEKETD